MSTLKVQIKELQNQISLSSNAQENETIIAANTNVLKRLNKSLDELTNNKRKFKAIQNISTYDDQLFPSLSDDEKNGYLINESTKLVLGDDVKVSLESAKKSISIFSEKWEEINFKAQQDDSLSDSTISLQNFTKIINNLNDSYWNKWINNLEMDFFVDEAILKQQVSLGRKDVLQKYNDFKAKFDTEKLLKDVNAGLVSSLYKLRGNLIEARDEMDRSDLPEGVAEFLKELDAPWSTPTLQLVTPTVFDWLDKQGLLSKLKISR
jgi:hypothetical protein